MSEVLLESEKDVNSMSKEDKLEYYISEINLIVDQILQWIEPNSCRCSYFPLRNTVSMAINWEIGEIFRLIRLKNQDAIEDLAKYILSNEK